MSLDIAHELVMEVIEVLRSEHAVSDTDILIALGTATAIVAYQSGGEGGLEIALTTIRIAAETTIKANKRILNLPSIN